ncbi:hypothetical protein CIHG_03030 [Coccidioides immitis H538.4]|uniref:Uncharacterized protein n=1 Tax=Coccidioides immitis H538.4 TaxID=396776 RepID=A0A0J8RKT0_COCIT|nr:hypothetical protein CIHG_03030 [Coccidioides immitis H538.4]
MQPFRQGEWEKEKSLAPVSKTSTKNRMPPVSWEKRESPVPGVRTVDARPVPASPSVGSLFYVVASDNETRKAKDNPPVLKGRALWYRGREALGGRGKGPKGV